MSMKILLATKQLLPTPEDDGDPETRLGEPQVLFAMESHDASEEFKAHVALEMFRLMVQETGNREADGNDVIAAEFIIRIEYP
jgi:hypothetical protein